MDREKLKWVFGLGIILMLAGASVLFVPSIGALSDITVDSTPPTIDSFQPSGTETSPTTYGTQVSDTTVISEASVSDSLSGVARFHLMIKNMSDNSPIAVVGGTTHYSRIRSLLQNYDVNNDGSISSEEEDAVGSDIANDVITLKEGVLVGKCRDQYGGNINDMAPADVSVTSNSITVEAGDIFDISGQTLPEGDLIRYQLFAWDEGGNGTGTTGYSTAEPMSPGGYFTINGQDITDVQYVTTNQITWGFTATQYPEYVTGVTIDIDTQEGSNVKEISLAQTSGDTWEENDTLSDGRYTVQGIVNGNTLLQCTFGFNTKEKKPLMRSETLGIVLVIAGIVLAGYSGEELFSEKS